MNRRLKRYLKYGAATVGSIAVGYFFPIPLMVLVLCGVWDVSRNRDIDVSVVKQYFFKNGVGTWLASPINILLDILALPYLNKGTYRLDELPPAYREELKGLLQAADDGKLVDRLRRYMGTSRRTMLFFKWYGRDLDAPIEMPGFRHRFHFVRTIGVSAFRARENTSRHFGPFRPSLRVLYALNQITDPRAYIKVGPVEHRWKDDRLFIFDDTLLHQSFNDTDETRYVLFVDILRPSLVRPVFDVAVMLIRVFFKGMNGIFYKNWKLVNN